MVDIYLAALAGNCRSQGSSRAAVPWRVTPGDGIRFALGLGFAAAVIGILSGPVARNGDIRNLAQSPDPLTVPWH